MNMEITINGIKRTDFVSPLTVADLLAQLGINPRSVVVERNLEIVARNVINEMFVQGGDTIEIIRIVGGG